jgi:hypothetical protein
MVRLATFTPVHSVLLVLLALLLAGAPSVLAQSGRVGSTRAALRQVIDEVRFDATPASSAFEWLSRRAGLKLVIGWRNLEAAGYPADTPVSLRLRHVPASTVLRLLIADVFGADGVRVQLTPNYVRILPLEQARAETVVRIYDIAGLLHEAPNFEGPDFDLNSVASDSGGGGGSIFDDEGDDDEITFTRVERAEQLADLIANSIEPDLWRRNGGIHGSIRYYDGRLIIRAPEYVHRQIGGGMRVGGSATGLSTAQPRSAAPRVGRYVTVGERVYAEPVRPRSYRPTPQYHRPYYYSSPHRRTYGRSNGISGIDWSQRRR